MGYTNKLGVAIVLMGMLLASKTDATSPLWGTGGSSCGECGWGCCWRLSCWRLRGAQAEEQYITVQILLSLCDSPVGSAADMLCVGIVSGVADTMSFNGLALKSLPPQSASLIRRLSICGNTTHGAEIQAFKNWAQAHPEQWTIRGSAGVILALAQIWPCS